MGSPATTDRPPQIESGQVSRAFDAVIFDMDGVITRTASVHARAWRRMFDEFLEYRAARFGPPLRMFEYPRDYLDHIDGRPRHEGVATFLRSRGITLPSGTRDDPPGYDTIWALGNLKNTIFNRIVADEGVEIYPSSVVLIKALRERGVRIGLVTSSRNAEMILQRTGTANLFETVVDGFVAERVGLRGKPDPHTFLIASAALDVAPARAVVVEDAVSGVQAGSRGGFALTLGVAREANAEALGANGADWVVADLAEVSVPELDRLVRRHRPCSGTVTP